eukprot:365152-Chlamydomonas_euryale.AAC.5
MVCQLCGRDMLVRPIERVAEGSRGAHKRVRRRRDRQVVVFHAGRAACGCMGRSCGVQPQSHTYGDAMPCHGWHTYGDAMPCHEWHTYGDAMPCNGWHTYGGCDAMQRMAHSSGQSSCPCRLLFIPALFVGVHDGVQAPPHICCPTAAVHNMTMVALSMPSMLRHTHNPHGPADTGTGTARDRYRQVPVNTNIIYTGHRRSNHPSTHGSDSGSFFARDRRIQDTGGLTHPCIGGRANQSGEPPGTRAFMLYQPLSNG